MVTRLARLARSTRDLLKVIDGVTYDLFKLPANHICDGSQCPGKVRLPPGDVMRTKPRKCAILVEFGGQIIRSDHFASEAEKPVEIAMKLRNDGWKPFKVRFDDSQ